MVQPVLQDPEDEQPDLLVDESEEDDEPGEISPEEAEDEPEDPEPQEKLSAGPAGHQENLQPEPEVIPEWHEPMNQVNQRLSRLEEGYQKINQPSLPPEPPKSTRQLRRDKRLARRQLRLNQS